MPMVAPAQTAMNTGELSPLMYGRVDFAKYKNAMGRCYNHVILTQGPVTRRPGTQFVAEVKDSAKAVRGFRFEFSTTQAYVLEIGDLYIRIYKDHGRVESGGSPVEITTTYTEAEIWDLKFTQSADTLYIAHPAHAPAKLTRSSHILWTLSTMTFEDGPYLSTNTETTTLTPGAATGSTTLTASSIVGINGGTGFATTDVGRHVRLKTSTNAWGWARITSWTSTTVVGITIIQTFTSAVATATWRLGAWSDTTGYPAAVTFNEDRLNYAGQTALPQTVFGSYVGSYQNFAPTAYDTSATVTDSHAYSFTLNSNDVQVIRWMVSDEKGLLIGTYSAEWVLRASTSGQLLSPTNVVARQTTKYGSNSVRPVQAGKATLFVQKSGRKLREMAYDYAIDGFRAPNMSILSEHLTEGGIVDMDFQQEPHSIVWAVRDDGVLLGFAYDREQNEFGWCWAELGGVSTYEGLPAAVESVAVIPAPAGGYDEVWMVVRRYINGQTVRYIEYMTKYWETGDDQAEACYLDCAATYNNPGVPVSSITSGLDHLKNTEVSVMVDGAEHPNVTVSNTGTLDLEVAGEVIQVGLGYNSEGKLLRFDSGSANGTAQGKIQRVHKVTFRVLDSLNLEAGPSFDSLDPLDDTYRTLADNLGEAPQLFTGDAPMAFDGDYTTMAEICWRFSGPFPGTVLLVAPQMDTNDNV